MHKPHIHKELTDILAKYSNERADQPNPSSNIMNEVMECVWKDAYLAKIFKSYLDPGQEEEARSATKKQKVF